jgi:hypothetical protein
MQDLFAGTASSRHRRNKVLSGFPAEFIGRYCAGYVIQLLGPRTTLFELCGREPLEKIK